jgi:hypothetical protein
VVLVGAIGACGGATTKGGEPAATDGGDASNSGDASEVVSLNDAGVLTCTATPISGPQFYTQSGSASGPDGTCTGAGSGRRSATRRGMGVWSARYRLPRPNRLPVHLLRLRHDKVQRDRRVVQRRRLRYA